MSALSIKQRLDLRQGIASWSDRSQKEAAAFSKSHSNLLPRKITNAQLSGLNNIVQSTSAVNIVESYIKNQGEKAERAGYDDVVVYWQGLSDTIKKLQPDAEKLLSGIGISSTNSRIPKEYKALLDEVCLILAREWVQHLVAHSLFLGRQLTRPKEEKWT